MHLKSIEFKDCPPPLVEGRLNFDQQVNVFIGPNGVGKSTLLRRIYREYLEPVDYGPRGSCQLKGSEEWTQRLVPIQYIPATRTFLHIRPYYEHTDLDYSEALGLIIDDSSDTFRGEYVETAIHALLRDSSPDPVFDDKDLVDMLAEAYLCTQEICGEVIAKVLPQAYVDAIESIGQERIAAYRLGMGIAIKDTPLAQPLYAGALSAGTQGTLLWIWSLALKTWDHYLLRENPIRAPAILLIDEIENHLHPTWQRRVIPALLKHFPGLQIFATTHSPFVVAGLKAGQVHLLKRDGEGRVTATTNTEDVVGWTADEILRNMMGVDDPTDDATAAAARELRQLRNEMPLADEEAEAQRQERIQELRQKVNRDLLAGGPMAAQRELFEENLSSILEQYRKSRDLNQENN